LSNAGCAEKAKVADAPVSPAKEAPAPAPAPVAPVADTPDAAGARWSEIKDLSYDSREAFFTGHKRLQARLDEQISELVARRAAMKADKDTKDWDFAMKELGNARSYFTGTGEVLAKASPDTWGQEKDRVGEAWVRAQTAYAKVKASTTN
ncbi:MAG: hypothetical protein ABUL65_03385, partial [Opitutus sp.]